MNLPETCPFCGAERDCEGPGSWVGFTCLTSIHVGQETRRTQSRACEGLERTRLLARIAALEAEAKQAREDEAWAEAHDVGIDSEPVENGWHAVVVIGEYPLMEIIWANGPTTHAALRALRAKVEGGAR